MSETILTPTEDAALRITRAIFKARAVHMQLHTDKPFVMGDVVAVVRAQLAIEFPKGKATSTAKASTATDEEWIASLEALEIYRYIDVRRELGKAQVWAGANKRQMSRRRFVNWLNKADATIGYDARGKSSADAQRPKSNAPSGWLNVLNRLYPDSVIARGGPREITEETDYNWSQLDKGIQRAIVGDLKYGTTP